MTSYNRRYPAIEGEYEDEHEDEDFLGGLGNLAGSLLGEDEFEFEFELEAESEMEGEGELEDEFEAEWEDEAAGFANPVRRIYRDAELMAHLSTRAAQAEGEQEAEAFIGALVPLAAKLIPRAASLVSRNAPALIKGANRLGRQLRRNPRTRGLVRTMPVILQKTAQVLADQGQYGSDLAPDDVLNTLTSVADGVLDPRRRDRALRAVGVFDRRYHRRHRWERRRRNSTWRRRHYARSNYAGSASAFRARRHTPVRGARRARRRY